MNFNEFLRHRPGCLMSECQHVIVPVAGGIIQIGYNDEFGIAG